MKERGILFSAPMVRALLDGSKTQTRRVMSPQPSAFVPSANRHEPKHESAYFDCYCSEPKTTANPRGMSDRWCWWTPDNRQGADWIRCPFGVPGDRLWVRETFGIFDRHSFGGKGGYGIAWRATHPEMSDGIEWVDGPEEWSGEKWVADNRWRPSIFMPRWASRITREIVNVCVERLQDITEEDASAEGVTLPDCTYAFADDATGERSNDRPCFKNSCPRHGRLDRHRLAFRSLWDAINGKRDGASWEENPWVWAITMKPVPA